MSAEWSIYCPDIPPHKAASVCPSQKRELQRAVDVRIVVMFYKYLR
jgi:hypothetical protein